MKQLNNKRIYLYIVSLEAFVFCLKIKSFLNQLINHYSTQNRKEFIYITLKAIIIYLQSSACYFSVLSSQLFANPDIISPADDCLPSSRSLPHSLSLAFKRRFNAAHQLATEKKNIKIKTETPLHILCRFIKLFLVPRVGVCKGCGARGRGERRHGIILSLIVYSCF